jgi:hypothetical protein
MVDLKKYDKSRFSRNPVIDKKIKALYLLFDKNVEDLKLGYYGTQRLINVWIKKLVVHEEYELAEAFKQRKISMWRNWRKVHRLTSIKLFWRVWRVRIGKLKRKFIK